MLLHSSEDFGPSSIRELKVSVTRGCNAPSTCYAPSGPSLLPGCIVRTGAYQGDGATCSTMNRFSYTVLSLQSEAVSLLVKIPGIITAAAKPKVRDPRTLRLPLLLRDIAVQWCSVPREAQVVDQNENEIRTPEENQDQRRE